MDDGIGIRTYFDTIGETSQEFCDIAIAITNVPSYLVSSNLSSNSLINSLSNTCSIYLPNNVINMIPKIFAEQICSFIKNEQEQENNNTHKPALVLHILWNNTNNIIVKQELKIENVMVKHNFVYDTQDLLKYEPYSMLFDVVKKINELKHFETCQTIHDSHDVVAYLMTFMNFYVMEWLETRNIPCIYRINQKRNIQQLPQNLQHLERKIGNYAGEYSIDKQSYDENKSDCIIWTHITSPMRRLADLTNMISISLHLFPTIYEPLKDFRDYCLTIVPRINNEYKYSRRIGLDCELFNFIKHQSTNLITDKVFEGIIIDIEPNKSTTESPGNNTHIQDYIIYIEELSRMFDVRNIGNKYELYDNVKCRIILFDKGYNIKQKVRVMIL